MAQRWFWLAKNMAGRVGDTHDIGPPNIKLKDGQAYLVWQPKKKGSKPVEVPLMLELAEELEAGGVHEDAVLDNDYGRPFASSGSLDNRIRKWVIAAGLFKLVEEEDPKTKKKKKVKNPTRSQYGIRKATAHDLAPPVQPYTRSPCGCRIPTSSHRRHTSPTSIGLAWQRAASRASRKRRKRKVSHGRKIVGHLRRQGPTK